MSELPLRLYLVTFLSGLAALVYEVLWTRLFSNITGSTVTSASLTFTVFLLCLAVGAATISRLRASPNPFRAYAALECSAAIFGLISTWLMLTFATELAAWLSSRPDNAFWPAAAGLAAALMGPGAVALGGTLPLILEASKGWANPRQTVAALYGANLLGASAGALLTGFACILLFGIMGSALLAAALNLICAGLAWTAKAAPDRGPTSEPEPFSEGGSARQSYLLLAFLSGWSVLGLEVLLSRIAKLLLGDRTLAVSLLLSLFLLGLAAGSWAVERARRRREPGQAIGLAGAAFAGGAVTVLGTLVSLSLWLGPTLLQAGLGVRLGLVALMVLPTAAVLGVTFPALSWGAPGLESRPGRAIGDLYFWSTVGGVAGALVVGSLIRGGESTVSTSLLLCLSLLLGVVLSLPRQGWVAAALGAIVLLCWLSLPKSLVVLLPGETLLASNEDEYGIQVVARTPEGFIKVRNNWTRLAYHLGHPGTRQNQQIAAHLGTLLPRRAGTALNIGTGYGITAGTLTLYPTWEAITSVEVLPFISHNQQLFQEHNFRPWTDPRFRQLTGDGRQVLAAAEEESYDLITVNVLDPHLPGSSGLFSVDFWRLAETRLRPGGVYTQLFWGPDVPGLLKGLGTVFPNYICVRSYGGESYNVFCFKEPLEGPTVHDSRLSPEAIEELESVQPRPLSEVLEQARLDTDLLRLAARDYRGPLHTDGHPVLEYSWATRVDGSLFNTELGESR